jgi:DNA-binding GntR family transcriptional regulator
VAGRAAPVQLIRPSAASDRGSRVYRELRELIIDGRLSPGARVIERDLVVLLHASRTPVRTALHRLQQEGYVVGPNDGASRQRLIVTPLTQEDATELLEMVGALEGIALRRVARFPESVRLELVAKLRQLNRAIAAAARGKHPDPGRVSAIVEDLHRTFFLPGAGVRLRAQHASLQPQTYRLRRLHHFRTSDLTPQSVEEHTEIIDAIERGDPRGAVLGVHKNWQNAAIRVCEVLARVGELGSL